MRKRGTVSTLRLLAATALGPAFASAQDAAPSVQSIDIYGSSVLDSVAAREQFGPDILRYVAIGMQAMGPSPTTPEKEAEIEAALMAIDGNVRTALESRMPLAYFEIAVTLGFGPPQQINVTLDVVEKADAARRMPFREAPTEKLDDPSGILALWAEYQDEMFRLAMAGAPMQVNESNCPVLHCVAPFDLPELAPYLERLNDGAREHEDELYAIAADSGDASQRANALFVLAHTNDAARLAPVLGRAIYDPNGGVRNNAMRVLMFLAQKRPDVAFPIGDLISALDFPSSSDRNKAGYTVAALADVPKYRDAIRADAVPVALRMLRLEQPNNHEPAYQILTKISGETFGERDYAAWERWAATR